MILLNPIGAVIAGAIGLPLLLALYFLKLRRRPVRVSSTMLWEESARDLQVNAPFRWIRASLLLFIQLIALLLLVAAIGRPVLEGAGGETRRVFVVLDRSASMSAVDEPDGDARLVKAKRAAADAVAALIDASSNAIVTVISSAATAEIVAPPSDRMSPIRRAIDSIPPTDQVGDLAPALDLVESLAAPASDESDTPSSRPILVLVTDGGEHDRDNLSVAGCDVRLVPIGPDAPGERLGNIGIVALGVAREVRSPSLVRVFARFESTEAGLVAVPIAIRRNGELVRREALRLPPATADGPGQLARTFEIEAPGDAFVTITIERDDALAADNEASAVLRAPSRQRVLVVAPARAPNSFLLDVLEALDFDELRIVDPVSSSIDQLVRAGSYDLVIFDRVEPDARPGLASLSFGAAFPALTMNPGPPSRVLRWRREHPALRDVTLDPLFVGQPMYPASTDDLQVLAYATGGALISEIDAGPTRHLIVGFDLAQSNWPLHFGFPVFIAGAIDYLAPGAGGAESFTTNEAATVNTRRPEGTVVISGPTERTARINADGQLVVGVLDRAGLYRIEPDSTPAEHIAVNLLSAGESSLITSTSLQIGGETVTARSLTPARRELWHIAVLGALALAMLDWVLYGLRAKR